MLATLSVVFFLQGDLLLPSSSWKLHVLSKGPHLCILCIFSVQVTNQLFVSVAKLNKGCPDVLWKFSKIVQVHQAFEPLHIFLPTPCYQPLECGRQQAKETGCKPTGGILKRYCRNMVPIQTVWEARLRSTKLTVSCSQGPTNHQTIVLQDIHGETTGGYLGEDKTFRKL